MMRMQVELREGLAGSYCKIIVATIAIAAAAAHGVIIPSISVGTTAATESFNSLGSSAGAALPTGWKVSTDASKTQDLISYSITSGSLQNAAGGGDTISLAGSYDLGSGSTDTGTERAVGFLAGTSGGTPLRSATLYAAFKTSALTDHLSISYDVDKFRAGTDPFQFQMYYATDGSSWTNAGGSFLTAFLADAADTSPSSLPITTTHVSATYAMPGSLSSGTLFYLAFAYTLASGAAYTDSQALAIDNFSIFSSFGTTPSPEPASTLIATTALFMMLGRRWRSGGSNHGVR